MNCIENCDHYMRNWLPSRLTPQELSLLSKIGIPVSICVQGGAGANEWIIQAREEGLVILKPGATVQARFRMSDETFLKMISGRMTPQRAFFTGRLRIEGDKFTALKVGSLLQSIFDRIPYKPEEKQEIAVSGQRSARPLSDQQKRILQLHLDPTEGSPFWMRKAEELGVAAEDFRTIEDLAVFGVMNRDDMYAASLRDFIPHALARAPHWILGETGGTTGAGLTAAWLPQDFRHAFVDPLPQELKRRNIRGLRQWLFVGPTGPHIIGKAADAVAQETTGFDALKVDFDPRWHRRLAPESLAARRHLEHILQQVGDVLRREDVDALFITPSILELLLDSPAAARLQHLRLVHLGGQSISPEGYGVLKSRLPQYCSLINGYGNSLFGCLVEREGETPLLYRSEQDRLVVRIVREDDPFTECNEGETGRVVFHRFDASMLILNQVERDVAERRDGGLVHPRPAESSDSVGVKGIY